MGETIQRMKAAANTSDASAKKWTIYSAHDLTLGYILNVMKMTNPHCIYKMFINNEHESDTCIF